MNEEALIQDAQRGDVAAYNRLVLHYQSLAYNVAYRIMGEPQSAEDMTQEAFVSAYKALNRFRGGNFKAWLLRIVTNACYDELRRHKRRPQSSLDELTEDNESFAFFEVGWRVQRHMSSGWSCCEPLNAVCRICRMISG